MARRVGTPKTGGKTKGTKNKRTLARELSVRERCEAFGYDPITAMVAIAVDTTVELNLRCDMHKALTPYLYPKLASAELKGSATQPLEVRVILE
jgi:hypothetical protein